MNPIFNWFRQVIGLLSQRTCITLNHDTMKKMKLKRILALGFLGFITRATIYGRWLFWLLFQLISLSLVFNSMLSFCKGQKYFIWLLTYSIWIMFYFCLPEILSILALITQRRRDVIFLHDLLVINILILFIFFK